ncbi:hypothetical protein BDV29DRAFT_156828 [Aspergillus leporis]|uniref:NmrA-like domain-containing protein n=1 Tax=Aspergillus leporis TaxID=41062 RepID=A0A5N5X2L3_9EURO|nr:hypothetical protein BDV29DRAFT_156828 [Aspergillus leporis]
MSRIFIIGATGYIGGDVLYALTQACRTSEISALVRNENRASLTTNKFPSVTPVIGALDSTTQITNEVPKADVFLHLASSHYLVSATAIARGLVESKRQRPVWIQLAGANLLSGPDIAANAYGEPRSEV